MDHMHGQHGIHMSPNSSLMVSVSMIICILNSYFSPFRMHYSPDIRLTHASEGHLLANSNTTYLQYHIIIKRQKWKIGKMENQIRALEVDTVIWKTWYTTAQWVLLFFHETSPSLTVSRETLDKLVQSILNTGLPSSTLSTLKEVPSPLDPKNYNWVCFWTAKSFETYCANLAGEMDSLATQPKKKGPWWKSDNNDDPHPYLERSDRTVVSCEILTKIGHKARRLWQAMNAIRLVPSSWGKASKSTYFNSEMLNKSEFDVFRFCDGNWKITRWATKAYVSWAHNHLKVNEADNRKTLCANKRKQDLLDDPLLIQIDDDKNLNDNIVTTYSPNSGPIEDNSNVIVLPAPSHSESASVPIQVCSYHLQGTTLKTNN